MHAINIFVRCSFNLLAEGERTCSCSHCLVESSRAMVLLNKVNITSTMFEWLVMCRLVLNFLNLTLNALN